VIRWPREVAWLFRTAAEMASRKSVTQTRQLGALQGSGCRL